MPQGWRSLRERQVRERNIPGIGIVDAFDERANAHDLATLPPDVPAVFDHDRVQRAPRHVVEHATADGDTVLLTLHSRHSPPSYHGYTPAIVFKCKRSTVSRSTARPLHALRQARTSLRRRV